MRIISKNGAEQNKVFGAIIVWAEKYDYFIWQDEFVNDKITFAELITAIYNNKFMNFSIDKNILSFNKALLNMKNFKYCIGSQIKVVKDFNPNTLLKYRENLDKMKRNSGE